MKSRKLTLTIIIVLSLVILLFFFLNGPRGTAKYYKAYQEKSNLETDIQALKSENEKLREEKEQLESDPAHIEKTAREKYSMKKEGEEVFKVQHKKKK